jgi:hypothetical protein
VLPAVNFNNQTPLVTNKVEDVPAKWHLAAETEPLEAMCP